MFARTVKLAFALFLSVSWLALQVSTVQSATWSGGGGDNNWMTPGNWGGAAPTPPEDLIFDGTLRLINTNDFAASTAFNSITFNAGAGAFVLSGNAITLNTNITDSSTNAQTINLPIALAGNSTISVTSGGSLTIGGVISGTGFGITKSDVGTLTLTGANTYNGATNIGTTAAGGTLAVGAGGTLGDGTSLLTMGGTTNTGALDLSAGSATVGGLSVLSNTATANTITIGSGKSLTVNGNVLIGGINGGATTANPITQLTMSGAGSFTAASSAATASFIVTNFKGANTGSGDTLNGILDVSGLGSFAVNYTDPGSFFGVGNNNGAAGASNGPFGKLILGANNTITAGKVNVGINNGGGNTSKTSILLGQTNVINTAQLNIGAGKTQTLSQTSPTGLVQFNTGLVNPTLKLRAQDGTSRLPLLNVGAGNLNANGSGTTMGGTLDLTAGSVDALVDVLKVGSGPASSTGSSTGWLLWNAGTIDANSAVLGIRGTAAGIGNVTLTGTAAFNVGTGGIKLGDSSVGSAGTPVGTLNINGGTVTMNGGDIFSGGGTANLNLNGGTLDMSGRALGTAASGAGALTGLGTSLVSGTLKNVGNVNAGGSLTKNVAGVLVLAGTNTYAGSTEISNGTIAVNGSTPGAGAVNVNTSASAAGVLSGTGSVGNVTLKANNGVNLARIAPGSTSADGNIGTLSMSSLTVQGGDFRYDFAAGNVSDLIAISGNATFSAASTITSALTSPPAGTYTLMTVAGAISGTAPSVPTGTRTGYTLHFGDGTSGPHAITLDISAAVAHSLIWTGTPGDGATWDTSTAATSKNWKDAADNSVQTFFNFDNVTFDDNGAGHLAVTLNGSVTPGSVVFNNTGANNYTISGTGSIDGSAATLTKNGSATATINTATTYGGNTTVGGGALILSKGLSGNGAMSIASGSTLQLGNGAATSIGAGAITDNGTLIVNRSDGTAATPATLSNAISGTGSVTIMGSGTTALATANTFSGGLTIGPGGAVVRLTGPASAGGATGIGTGTLTLGTGGSINVASNGNNAMSNAIVFSGGTLGSTGWGTGNGPNITTGDLTFTAGTTSTIKAGDPQAPTTGGSETSFSGALHGSGNLNLTADQTNPDGSAGIRLKNNSTVTPSDYSGTITVGQHVKFELAWASATATNPIGTGNVVMVSGNVSDGSYSEFQVRNAAGGSITVGTNLTITGAPMTADGVGIADLNVPAAVTNNVITMGTLRIGSQQLGVNKNSVTYSFPAVILSGTPTLSVNTPNVATIPGAASLILGDISETGGSQGLIIKGGAGPSSVTLAGNNTFTGGVTIISGILQLGNAGALNSTTPQAVTFPAGSTGTLRLNGFNVAVNSLTTDATTPGSPIVDAGPGGGTLTVNNAVDNIWAGALQDNGSPLSVTKTGAGALILTGDNNTLTGTITVNSGTLKVGNGGATGSLQFASIADNTNVIFDRSTDSTFGGSISGTGTVQKSSAGALTLTGSHSYSGTTTVSGGALVVNGSLLSTGNVSVASGGALSGLGTVGNVSLTTGGSIRPGNAAADGNIGTLNVNSLAVTGGDLRIEITDTSTHDLINATGSVSFSGGTPATITPIFTTGVPTAGQYTLITAGSITHATDPTVAAPGNSRLSFGVLYQGSNLVLNVTGTGAHMTWNGNVNSSWDAGSTGTANWSTADAVTDTTHYYNLDAVTFDDSTVNHNVVLQQNVTPTSITVSTGSTYTIDTNGKAIQGIATSLSIQSGKLILKDTAGVPGTNTFGGTMDVGGGTLEVGPGGTLGTGSVNGGGGTLRINRPGVISIGNLIGGSLNLEVNAGAALTLTNGSNTFSGAVNVLNGSLKIGTAGALPNTSPVAITLGDGGTNSGLVDLNGTNLSVSGLSANGTGASNIITNNSTTANSVLTFSAGSSTFSGQLKDGATKNLSLAVSSGSLTLSGSNTYSGANTITGGTLSFSTSGNLGNGSATNNIALGTAVAAAPGILQATATTDLGINRTIALGTGGGTIDVPNSGTALTVSGIISGTTALTKTGSGKLILTGVNTYTGTTNIGNSTLGDAGIVEAGPATAFAGLSGQVHFFNGAFHVTGNPGDVVVSAGTSNKYTTSGTGGSTGTFDIDNGVTLQVGPLAADANGDASSTTAALQTAGSGTAGANFIKAGAGTLRIVSQNNQLDSPLLLNAGTVDVWHLRGMGGHDNDNNHVDMKNNTTLILRHNTSGDFLTDLVANEAGANINVVVDRQTTSPGAGIVASMGRIQSSVGDFTLHVTSGPNITSGAAAYTLAGTGAGTLGGNATFDVVNNGSIPMTMTVAGALGSTGGGVVKTGNGTLILSGANTYTGTTTVSGGTLRVNGTHSGGGNYTVGGGATLGGNGTIGSSVTVNAGGIIDPGTTIGTLTASNVTFNGLSQLNIDLNDAIPALSDVLNVNAGALALNSTALNFNVTGALGKQVYVFAKYGTLTGNPFGSANVPSGYSINYNYQNLHEIALVSPYLLGDFDRNGIVDSNDIPVMLQALTDLNVYKTQKSLTDAQLLAIGDFDSTGSVTNGDIQPMLNYVASFQAGSGGIATIPEPASVVLMGFGAAALLVARRLRRKPQLMA